MKRVSYLLPIEDIWRPLVGAICVTILLIGLLTFRLGTLTPGFSSSEIAQRQSATSVSSIVNNPLHLNQKGLQFVSQQLRHKGPLAMRLPSITVGFVAVISMFIILKRWYSVRVAILGSSLFATSSWFLHTSRLATGDVNFVLPLVLMVAAIWLRENRFVTFAGLVAALASVLMLYVPGLVWLVIPAIIWQRHVLKMLSRRMPTTAQAAAIILTLVGLAPLVWSFVYHPQLMRTWLGLPDVWPGGVMAYLKNIVSVPMEIFIRGSGDPVYGIGRLPLLDAFTSAMVALGAYASLFRLGLDRTKLFIGAIIISVLLIALKGPVTISFLLPIVYLLAAGGMALLLQQWFTVFPRNPVARVLGPLTISLVVLLTCYYHLSHYFIAWPNVPATKQTFSQRP